MINHRKKYNAKYCNDNMTFEECELAILRNAVDETEKLQGEKLAKSEDVVKIISILEQQDLYKYLMVF
jgi:hypothetical protein